MTEDYYIKPHEFQCAKEFLDALDETNEFWRGETWIYRGQNVDKYLLPTSMREDATYWQRKKMANLNPENEPLGGNPHKSLESAFKTFQENKLHRRMIEKFLENYSKHCVDV